MAYTVRANTFSEVQLSEEDAAYLAGLLDGEGSIHLVARKCEDRKSHHFGPAMTIANTNLALLEWIVQTTGNGRIMKNSQDEHPNHKQGYTWQLGARQIRHLLPQVMPYLRIKRRQAELLLEFFDLQQQADRGPRGWHQVPPELIARILNLYEELRLLNRRGLAPIEELDFTIGEGKERKRICDEEGCNDRRYRAHTLCYKHWLQQREPHPGKCEECGAAFDAIMPHRRFCSEMCQWRNAALRREGRSVRQFTCPQCGVDVVTADTRKKTCSQTCTIRLKYQERKKNGYFENRKR